MNQRTAVLFNAVKGFAARFGPFSKIGDDIRKIKDLDKLIATLPAGDFQSLVSVNPPADVSLQLAVDAMEDCAMQFRRLHRAIIRRMDLEDC